MSIELIKNRCAHPLASCHCMRLSLRSPVMGEDAIPAYKSPEWLYVAVIISLGDSRL